MSAPSAHVGAVSACQRRQRRGAGWVASADAPSGPQACLRAHALSLFRTKGHGLVCERSRARAAVVVSRCSGWQAGDGSKDAARKQVGARARCFVRRTVATTRQTVATTNRATHRYDAPETSRRACSAAGLPGPMPTSRKSRPRSRPPQTATSAPQSAPPLTACTRAARPPPQAQRMRRTPWASKGASETPSAESAMHAAGRFGHLRRCDAGSARP